MKVISQRGRARTLRPRSGQSLVEFVLIAPLLLLLFFGIVEFARAWNIRHVITDAAREGARNMAVDNNMTVAQVRTIVENSLQAAGLNPGGAQIELTPCALPAPDCPTPNDHVTNMPARASIRYPYELRLVRIFLGWGPWLDINTTFVMRNE